MEPTLGDQELAVLRYIADHAPISAGEVSSGYGEPNGLARSTIETVMERLRRKGFLSRAAGKGGFRYSPTLAPQEVMGGLVEQFVEKTLDGSFLPFVAYFSKQNRLSDSELAELERLIKKLQEDAS